MECVPVFCHATTGSLHLLCKFRIVRGLPCTLLDFPLKIQHPLAYFDRISCKAGITEHDAQRFVLCQLFDQLFVHAGIKAGDKVVWRLIYKEECFTLNQLFADWQAQVKEYLKEQVFRCAVGFHVVNGFEKVALFNGIGCEIDLGHVGGVDFEDAEAERVIKLFAILDWLRKCQQKYLYCYDDRV